MCLAKKKKEKNKKKKKKKKIYITETKRFGRTGTLHKEGYVVWHIDTPGHTLCFM